MNFSGKLENDDNDDNSNSSDSGGVNKDDNDDYGDDDNGNNIYVNGARTWLAKKFVKENNNGSRHRRYQAATRLNRNQKITTHWSWRIPLLYGRLVADTRKRVLKINESRCQRRVNMARRIRNIPTNRNEWKWNNYKNVTRHLLIIFWLIWKMNLLKCEQEIQKILNAIVNIVITYVIIWFK